MDGTELRQIRVVHQANTDAYKKQQIEETVSENEIFFTVVFDEMLGQGEPHFYFLGFKCLEFKDKTKAKIMTALTNLLL